MTSQRLVEDFARWLWEWDWREWNANHEHLSPGQHDRVPHSYMNEAAVFLAGELGQRLQHGDRVKKGDLFDWNGVRVEVLRVDKSGGWADIKSTGPTGLSWTKRQLLPLGAMFVPVEALDGAS